MKQSEPVSAALREVAEYNISAITLDEIKALPEIGQAYYGGDPGGEWEMRFRVKREVRRDGTQAELPSITASNGTDKIWLKLSRHHGWYIRQHCGNTEFNRSVLKFLNKGQPAVGEHVLQLLEEV